MSRLKETASPSNECRHFSRPFQDESVNRVPARQRKSARYKRERASRATDVKVQTSSLFHLEGSNMSLLKWALIMLVVSLVAALFGFTNISAASADVARILFYIFLAIFLVLLVLGLLGARAARGP